MTSALQNVQDDPCGKLEEHFEKCDGSDARARLFAEWFHLSNKPEVGHMLWNCALSPGENPKPCGLDTVGCFE